MLLSLSPGNFEGLVLGLDTSDLALDFLFPALALLSLALVGTILETPNLIKLGFLLYLEKSLLYGL